MIPPQLGTQSRPDTTGVDFATPTRFLGISRPVVEDGISNPWEGLKLSFWYPEARFGAPDNYEVECSEFPNFEQDKAFANRTRTGFAGEPAAADFNHTFFDFTPHDSGSDIVLAPGTQYFVRVRAVHAAGPSAWSESCGAALTPVPTPAPPSAAFTFVDTLLSVVYTNTSVAGAAPIVSFAWDFNLGESTTTVEDPTYEFAGAGTFPVTLTITDEFGSTDTTTQIITVVAA